MNWSLFLTFIFAVSVWAFKAFVVYRKVLAFSYTFLEDEQFFAGRKPDETDMRTKALLFLAKQELDNPESQLHIAYAKEHETNPFFHFLRYFPAYLFFWPLF